MWLRPPAKATQNLSEGAEQQPEDTKAILHHAGQSSEYVVKQFCV